MEHLKKDQSPKKELVTDPVELKRLTDFFALLMQIDRRKKRKEELMSTQSNN